MMVGYNGALCDHKNIVIEDYLLKWEKTFMRISESKAGYESHTNGHTLVCKKQEVLRKFTLKY